MNKSLLHSIEAAKDLYAFLEESNHDRPIADSPAVLLFAAHYERVRELYSAILRLLSFGDCDASAFALAYPLVESAYKAHWIVNFAKPTEIARILRGVHCHPPLETMADRVENVFFTDPMFASLTLYFAMLQSSPYPSTNPVNRCLGEVGLRNSFSIQERRQLVNLATLHLVALSIAEHQMTSPESGTSYSHVIDDSSNLARVFAQEASVPALVA